MVLTLVLLMFIVVIGHDFYIQRRQARRLEVLGRRWKSGRECKKLTRLLDERRGRIQGARKPCLSSGAPWAAQESRQVVRVGLDDFAARVVGQIDQIDLPARGRWLRQGERGWTIGRGAHRFEMLSPIEGEVVDINTAVLGNPSLAHEDPYGAGWLVAVQAPAVDGNMKNLLHGRLAQRWMEESVGALHTRISPGSEAYLQDGGHAIGDMLSLVPEAEWEKFVEEMLLG